MDNGKFLGGRSIKKCIQPQLLLQNKKKIRAKNSAMVPEFLLGLMTKCLGRAFSPGGVA